MMLQFEEGITHVIDGSCHPEAHGSTASPEAQHPGCPDHPGGSSERLCLQKANENDDFGPYEHRRCLVIDCGREWWEPPFPKSAPEPAAPQPRIRHVDVAHLGLRAEWYVPARDGNDQDWEREAIYQQGKAEGAKQQRQVTPEMVEQWAEALSELQLEVTLKRGRYLDATYQAVISATSHLARLRASEGQQKERADGHSA